MDQPYREWSEFNALGAIAWDKFHDQFTWINSHDARVKMPELVAIQKWSKEPLTDEVKAEFEELLTHKERNMEINPAEVTATLSTTATTIGFIDDAESLATRLKALMRNQYHTKRVHLILHEAGVIRFPKQIQSPKGLKRKKPTAT